MCPAAEETILGPGARIGERYEVRNLLGRGGAGTTFRAFDRERGEEVALKLGYEVGRGDADPLRGEFLSLRAVRHPHLAELLDFGRVRVEETYRSFMATRLVEGVALDAWAGHTRPSWDALEALLCDVLGALGAMHGQGLVHGDVAPKNVLVSNTGATVIDLSCARSIGERALSGTAGFIAPELLLDAPASVGSDLYALARMIERVVANGDVPVPTDRRRLLDRLGAENPRERPSSVDEVLDLLRPGRGPTPARPMLRLVGRSDALAAFGRFLRTLRGRRDGPRTFHVHGVDGSGRTRLLEELKWAAQAELEVVTLDLGDPRFASTSALLATLGRHRQHEAPTLYVRDDLHRLAPDAHARVLAMVRMLDRDGTVGLLLAGDTPLAVVGATDVLLGPLSIDDVARVAGGGLAPAVTQALMRTTGGFPGAVRAVLTAAGDVPSVSAIERAASGGDARLVARGGEQRALAWLVACEGSWRSPDASGATPRDFDALVARGWVRSLPDGGYTLDVSPADVRASIEVAALAAAHRALAARVDPEVTAPAALAERLVHLVLAGDAAAASALVTQRHATILAAPTVFRRACTLLVEHTLDPVAVTHAATVLERCGDFALGLRAIARALGARPPAADRARLRRAAAACHARAGHVERAERSLRRAMDDATDDERARVAADLSLALLRRGLHAESVEVAREGARAEADATTTIDLACTLAMGLDYGGHRADANERIAFVREFAEGKDLPARTRYRMCTTRALLAFRAGATAFAASAYAEALALAEEHGLDDAVAVAATNLGTARHQLGDWGGALDAYGRGQRIAQALGDAVASILFELNLAKLLADIGQHDRADARLERAREDAAAAKLGFITGALDAVAAEVAFARGDDERCATLVDRALERFEAMGAQREIVELSLQRLELDLRRAAVVVEGRVHAILRDAESLGAPDITARARQLEARWRIVQGDARGAIDLLEAAVVLADETQQLPLRADVEATLSLAYRAVGAETLATHHRRRALERWERVLATLPSELVAPFMAHPKRSVLAEPPTPQAPEPAADRNLAMRRLLDVTRQLNSARTPSQVLEATMDAVIELSRAERGFLLLREERRLRVAVARSFGQEKLTSPQRKFSRTIAAHAIERGEPIVTTDAEADTRFGDNASIHALQLKAVACLPIRSPEGILGAIYLDNRFRAGSFQRSDVELLLAFCDQAAVVLLRARQHDELVRRTEELERERARIEEVVSHQAVAIERLHERLRDPRPARSGDYGTIIGSGPSMQRVFDLLDRVVAVDVTVLLSGESGTGKELVARAIHRNSERRDAPFVALNCGALPEALLEAELFGYRRGAFTGATQDRSGLLASAAKGTVFLDEIGDMPLAMQVKLLRVLQEREVTPLGATEPIAIDVRVIGATHKDLREEVAAGRFREDLYYRLAVIEVHLPPLRERVEDLPELAAAILARVARSTRRAALRLDRSAERALTQYAWPGNVRELENVLTKASLLATGPTIDAATLQLGAPAGRPGYRPAEAAKIGAALAARGWNVAETARALDIPRPTFYRKLRRYGLLRPKGHEG